MTQHENNPVLPSIGDNVHYILPPRSGETTRQNDGSRAPLSGSARSISVIGQVIAVNNWETGGGAVVIRPEASRTPWAIVENSTMVASAVRQPFTNTDLLRQALYGKF